MGLAIRLSEKTGRPKGLPIRPAIGSVRVC